LRTAGIECDEGGPPPGGTLSVVIGGATAKEAR
jgi:hypothetical protein